MYKIKYRYIIIIFIIILSLLYIIINIMNKSDKSVNNIWFNHNDIELKNNIELENIEGYVLPHASTKYTGDIISHTLRFKPKKYFNKVYIIYYPSQQKPNVDNKYYHEYYVPWQTLKYVIRYKWKVYKIKYIGVNINEYDMNKISLKDSLIVVSADFSHFLPLKQAIDLENRAAHGLMFRDLNKKHMRVVDDVKSFEILYELIPNNWNLQWIGRTRSPGLKGVGYLSFIIKNNSNKIKLPDSIFITAYDQEMNTRECLGEWYNKNNKYSKKSENLLKNKVLHLAKKTSRLTGGKNKEIPLTHYSISYLYKDNKNDFIKGWHGIKYNAFYLPEVMLENVYDNGQWMKHNDKLWPQIYDFNIDETLSKLVSKSGNQKAIKYDIYYNDIHHFDI